MTSYLPIEFWKQFKQTHGAFSTAEAIALYNICLEAPAGRYAEFGVHKGKSAMTATLGLKVGLFILVDPELKDPDWAEEVFSNIWEAAHSSVVAFDYVDDFSINAIPFLKNLCYVFIDSGSHSDDLPMQEVKMLEDKMVQGGIIAFHDKGSQFTKVDEAYNYLLSTGKYEEIKTDWQPIFDYVKEHNLEEGNNSWHLYPELPHPPNFVAALKRI